MAARRRGVYRLPRRAARSPAHRRKCSTNGPQGIITSFYDVHLTTREVTVIPDTHDPSQKWSYTLPEAEMKELIALLDTPSLLALSSEVKSRGGDGATVFLKFKRAGEYRWFAYWRGEHPRVFGAVDVPPKRNQPRRFQAPLPA